MHPHSGVQHRYLVKHWKDRLNKQKKNMYLRAAVFYVKTQIHFEYPDKFTIHTFLQSSEKNKDTLSQSIP